MNRHLVEHSFRELPVIDGDGVFLGMVSLKSLTSVPRDRWDATAISVVMDRRREDHLRFALHGHCRARASRLPAGGGPGARSAGGNDFIERGNARQALPRAVRRVIFPRCRRGLLFQCSEAPDPTALTLRIAIISGTIASVIHPITRKQSIKARNRLCRPICS